MGILSIHVSLRRVRMLRPQRKTGYNESCMKGRSAEYRKEGEEAKEQKKGGDRGYEATLRWSRSHLYETQNTRRRRTRTRSRRQRKRTVYRVQVSSDEDKEEETKKEDGI